MKTVLVSGCTDCPCNSTVYDSGGCYAGTQCLLSSTYMECGDGDRTPEKCPLRKGPVALRLEWNK